MMMFLCNPQVVFNDDVFYAIIISWAATVELYHPLSIVLSQLVIALLIANIKEKAFSSITWWKLVKLYLDVKWAINCLQIRKCDSIKKMRRILRQKQVVFANIEHLWLIFIWKLLCCMKHLKICKLHCTNWYFLV